MSDSELAEIKETLGRPCPRAELPQTLRLESKILATMLSERGGPFAVELVRTLVPQAERAAFIYRLMAVDSDPRVAAARKIAEQTDRDR